MFKVFASFLKMAFLSNTSAGFVIVLTMYLKCRTSKPEAGVLVRKLRQ
jgi:hypothetical protein